VNGSRPPLLEIDMADNTTVSSLVSTSGAEEQPRKKQPGRPLGSTIAKKEETSENKRKCTAIITKKCYEQKALKGYLPKNFIQKAIIATKKEYDIHHHEYISTKTWIN